MRVTLQHNTSTADVVFDNVHEIIFQPERVLIYCTPPAPEAYASEPPIIIKDQKTAGRRYWNYKGTWYPRFQIIDPVEAIQLRLI